MQVVFRSIFGNYMGNQYFLRVISLQDSDDSTGFDGFNCGGQEAFSLISGAANRAFGLRDHCQNSN
jgi:hypothetical protein